jgi:hypothetical protein
MILRITFIVLLIFLTLSNAPHLFAQTKPSVTRDNFSDTWLATDALGRSLPAAGAARPPRPDRFVGIFYFLWHDKSENAGPFDVSHILANDPEALKKNTSPPWGPVGKFHHWAEPLFGYYLTDDAWVIRKHAQMLTAAGVDVVIFDNTNNFTYTPNYMKLLEVYAQMRREGNNTPQVAFLTPFWDPQKTADKLFAELYSKHLYEDLWFRWKGKPLLLADPDKVSAPVKDFFTFRKPQPDYFQGPTGPDQWSWLEIYPQHVFKNSNGEKEQISVGVAQNAVGNRLGSMSEPGAKGRSFHNGAPSTQPGAVNLGLNYTEQWERALKEDPQFIFITGWNEWIAGPWPEFNGIKTPPMFVDQFDQEHSRDIEPMKAGHSDNYYYQTVAFIRRFKGARAPPNASPSKTINLDGEFSQWTGVTPEYVDDANDTVPRDHPGWNSVTRYVDRSGRNDFVTLKVAHDATNLYFYARTQSPITPSTDPNWMTLFLDTDNNPSTGWHGYDYCVNRHMKDASHSFLESTRTGWNWEPRAEIRFHVRGNELMLSIPRAALNLSDVKPLKFSFKWADNFQVDDDLTAFLRFGDAAPLGRFNYLYTTGIP